MPDRHRPLSPHLSVYRWQPHMLVSILHRLTGAALAVGSIGLVWGLVATASGQAAYQCFQAALASPLGRLVLFGFSWALMQHLASGLRHLYMDTGGGFAPAVSRCLALATLAFSLAATLLLWSFGYGLL
ncbi:MAG: succinate dehydrogenase, cytochrome b556 subunit [Alphaproteobacteria bacterium]|nr:MAG: succinate dehydrogenase, cytochrome b556 subunit [Alphaproteobacteria bacterium]